MTGPLAAPPAGAVALCVLAGGAGRRLDGRDKARLDLGDGRPMLARVLDRLAPWPGPVLVSAHAATDRARLIEGVTARRIDTVVGDALTEPGGGRAGPLAGLLAALEAVVARDAAVSWLVSVPVDLPFVPEDLLDRLWRGCAAGGAAGACAVSAGRRHPLVALWPVSVAPALRRALEREGLRRAGQWAERCGLASVSWPARDPDPFLNVNDAAALAAARAHAAPRVFP
ncbi:NTP transferase domain-containing protein [Roseospira visakhapatnamensis]|uniref:Molybdenum cofactor guanylyltransferase n=1 Tax=Roseospira visakhapatnamensis TaxID=390880 RepID=A0A7W6RBQ6_9PROT|nr:NTP transferase domain-containing protein [Roseospira visakhapatnamensis]MBB4264958.1 molybdopterin-guanine dinucleotide biosynthesis protein A [Roseospira visakhapatnamensis]